MRISSEVILTFHNVWSCAEPGSHHIFCGNRKLVAEILCVADLWVLCQHYSLAEF